MSFYPRTSIKKTYPLQNVNVDTFKERLRALSVEFVGTSSYLYEKLYLRKSKSPFEVEVIERDETIIITTSLLWSYKFIIRIQLVIFTLFILIGISSQGYMVAVYLGLIGYLILTVSSNISINRVSNDYLKLVKTPKDWK